jgi:hypothetical protein
MVAMTTPLRARILIADDDPEVLDLRRRLLAPGVRLAVADARGTIGTTRTALIPSSPGSRRTG